MSSAHCPAVRCPVSSSVGQEPAIHRAVAAREGKAVNSGGGLCLFSIAPSLHTIRLGGSSHMDPSPRSFPRMIIAHPGRDGPEFRRSAVQNNTSFWLA